MFKNNYIVACESGRYGIDCSQICSTNCIDVCNRADGSCRCKPGWKGLTCSKSKLWFMKLLELFSNVLKFVQLVMYDTIILEYIEYWYLVLSLYPSRENEKM